VKIAVNHPFPGVKRAVVGVFCMGSNKYVSESWRISGFNHQKAVGIAPSAVEESCTTSPG